MLKEDKGSRGEKYKIPLADARARLQEEGKIINDFVQEFLMDEFLKEQPDKPWLCLRRKTSNHTSLLFQKITGNHISQYNQVIQTFFFHDYYSLLIDPADYQDAIKTIKMNLEAKSAQRILDVQPFLSSDNKSSVESAHQEFLFLITETMFHIISSLNFLAYQYDLTSEWCLIQKEKNHYQQKFSSELQKYKSDFKIAIDEKHQSSEFAIQNKNLDDLNEYFLLLKNKKLAIDVMLKNPSFTPAELKGKWQKFITEHSPKLSSQPLAKLIKALNNEIKAVDKLRHQIANTFSDIQSSTENKLITKNNGDLKTNQKNDLSFSRVGRQLSYDSFGSIEDKEKVIKNSLEEIKAKLPKSGWLIKSVSSGWLDFYKKFENGIGSLVAKYDFYYDLYPKLCPVGFETNTIPAERKKAYDESYHSLNQALNEYVKSLREQLDEVNKVQQDLPMKILNIKLAIAEIQQEIIKFQQEYLKHLEERSVSSGTPLAVIPKADISIPPAEIKETTISCWYRIFSCCRSSHSSTQPLLQSTSKNSLNGS